MIYISTSCIKSEFISEAVLFLAENNIFNIELSGGTKYYDGFENDLIDLKRKYKLNYIIHNYFPPPEQDFVINLSSLNDDIYNKSIYHFKRAINLAGQLDIDKIGLHAGFLIDPSVSEIGKPIKKKIINNREQGIKRFVAAYKMLKEHTNIEIYVENNVVSLSNFENFGANPLLFTCYDEYKEMQEQLSFPYILDVAHLKVSSNTLSLDFDAELNKLLPNCNYLHLSDNDGKHDENLLLKENSNLLNKLSQFDLKNKIITLEIYENFDAIMQTHKLINQLC